MNYYDGTGFRAEIRQQIGAAINYGMFLGFVAGLAVGCWWQSC